MDIIGQETRASVALVTLSSATNSLPVYNSTTVSIGAKDDHSTAPSLTDTSMNRGVWAGAQQLAQCAPQQSQQQLQQIASDTEFIPQPFANLPPRDPVDIQFKDVTYNVNIGFRKGTKEILHKINGKFPGRQLISIMGPSGAGKSTLLDVLSGYRTTGANGAIFVNGRVRNIDTFRKMTCYITQDDRLQPLLTVLENMKIAAELKLGENVSKLEKEARIEDILTVLGLYEHQFTMTSRLSGGQKKRLSIALELINNPTIMFLDEPTTGLDSFSCTQVVSLLKFLASQGRTIICTIHQPSAKLFQEFDQVYVLAQGECLYQGCTNQLVPYLQSVQLPCPIYHNPADYIIELACGEYGTDKINLMVQGMGNGECLDWFQKREKILSSEQLRRKYPLSEKDAGGLHATNQFHQIKILLRRGIIKGKRDQTLTYLRISVNFMVAIMLGWLFIDAGNEASRVLDNYNLLFACLMHHMMTTMMLTVLTFPTEMSILLKENFNRWYSLKAYFATVTILDIPMSIFCCTLFTSVVYVMSAQPLEWFRFGMFFTISLLIVFVAQSIGLIIGAWFDVVNGTFIAPTMSVPMMMFAGFGVTLRDMPGYLKWGSYISYLRYGLEGYVGAIYGENRATLECEGKTYCHYKYPKKFLSEIAMQGDQFWYDVGALLVTMFGLRVAAYYLLKFKIMTVR